MSFILCDLFLVQINYFQHTLCQASDTYDMVPHHCLGLPTLHVFIKHISLVTTLILLHLLHHMSYLNTYDTLQYIWYYYFNAICLLTIHMLRYKTYIMLYLMTYVILQHIYNARRHKSDATLHMSCFLLQHMSWYNHYLKLMQ